MNPPCRLAPETISRQAGGMNDAPRFGTRFAGSMGSMTFDGTAWSDSSVVPTASFEMHPASHVFHYGSACFEGLKAHRSPDGDVGIFRLDRHMERLAGSATRVCLPVPSIEVLEGLVMDTVKAVIEEVPEPAGSLYLRPTLIGTDPDIGAAGSPSGSARLFVLASPVGDYFPGGLRPLRIGVETQRPRTTPQFGSVKAGANYVMALGVTMEYRRRFDVAQVLFVPDGRINETGASNVVLLAPGRIVTPPLDGSFLPGVTRDSVLTLASDRGFEVEERTVTLDELREWIPGGEIALTGTAAVLTPVGTLVIDGEDHIVGDGDVGPVTAELRAALVAVQTGTGPDPHEWRRTV